MQDVSDRANGFKPNSQATNGQPANGDASSGYTTYCDNSEGCVTNSQNGLRFGITLSIHGIRTTGKFVERQAPEVSL